jgi:hypothetical protein
MTAPPFCANCAWKRIGKRGEAGQWALPLRTGRRSAPALKAQTASRTPTKKVHRGISGTSKASVHSLRECVLSAAHAAACLDVAAQSLRRPPSLLRQSSALGDVVAQSLRCPPSLLRQSSAFGPEGRFAAHVSTWPAAAHLCGTRLEGGHRRLSRTLRLAWVEPKRAAVSSAGTLAEARGRCSATGYPQSLPHRPGVPGAARAGDGTAQRLSFPLHRIVVRDLGVHPRGEFRTSGAAVGQMSTGAASAAFPCRTRRTV